MKTQLKNAIVIISLLTFNIILAVNATPEHSRKTHDLPAVVKIGGVFPVEKRPDAGRDRRDAFLMAIHEINNQTGTDRILPTGVTLDYLWLDDDNNVTGGIAAAQALIAWGADIVIGSSSSAVSTAIATELTPFKIPQISYASSSPALSDRTLYPYFMRVSSSDTDQSIALADLVDAFGWTKGAIICTSDSFSTFVGDKFKTEFEAAGGTIITYQNFTIGASDVTTQVQAIKDAKPEFVLGSFLGQDAATTVKAAVDLAALDIPWLMTDGWSGTWTFSGDEKVKNGMQQMLGTTPTQYRGDGYSTFNASWFDPAWYWLEGPKHSQDTGTPFNTYAPLAYDAVYVAAKGLAAAGTTDGDILLAALYDVTHDGASGLIEFNSLGEVFRLHNYVQCMGENFDKFGEWQGSITLIPGIMTIQDNTKWERKDNKMICIKYCPGGPGPLPSIIKIGGIFPVEKRPDAGRDRRDAFLLAIHEINNQTGTDRILPAGVTLDYLWLDDNNNVTGGIAAAQALIAWGADTVIGSSSSAVSAAIATELTPYKIPQISYASSSPALSDRTLYPYFMRVSSSDADQGKALAGLVNAFGWTQGATIHTTDSYVSGIIDVFTEAFEAAGGTILTNQKFNTGTTDVTAQVQAIKDTQPEFVVGNFFDDDTGTVVKTAVDLAALDMPWLMTDAWSGTWTFSGDEKIKNGMQQMIGTSSAPRIGPTYSAFNTSWFDPAWYWLEGPKHSQDTGAAFNSYAPLAYDAVYAAARGFAAAGTIDGGTLLDALYNVKHEGASGSIEFNDLGEVVGPYDYVQCNGENFDKFGKWQGSVTLIPGTMTLQDNSEWERKDNKATCIKNCLGATSTISTSELTTPIPTSTSELTTTTSTSTNKPIIPTSEESAPPAVIPSFSYVVTLLALCVFIIHSHKRKRF